MPNDPQRLESLERKVDAIFISVEKTRKYLLVTAIVTIALVVFPAIGLLFAVPSFMSSYESTMSELGL